MYKIDDVSKMTGIHKRKIYRLIKAGLVPFVQRGARLIYLEEPAIRMLADFKKRERKKTYRKGITRKKAIEVVENDDAIMIDAIELNYLKQERAYFGDRVRGARPMTLLYARITPSYVVCLAAYLRVAVTTFMEMIGYQKGRWWAFHTGYNPRYASGQQVQFQCGMYWVVKCLYAEGVIPYGLARLGGVLDELQEEKELQALRRLRIDAESSTSGEV